MVEKVRGVYTFILEPTPDTVNLQIADEETDNSDEKSTYPFGLNGGDKLNSEKLYDMFAQVKEDFMDRYFFEQIHTIEVNSSLDSRDTYTYTAMVNGLQVRKKHPKFVSEFANKVLFSLDDAPWGIKIQYENIFRQDERKGKIFVTTYG